MVRQAVILCGGLGSRLGALTADTPKPLLPVDGNPFLDALLFELARHGVRRVLLLAGFAAQRIVDYAASTPLKARFNLEIEVSIETQRAGTGGAVWHARHRLDDRFFLLNGDSWFDINLLALASRVIGEPSSTGAIAVKPLADASRYGVVEIDNGRVTGFRDRLEGSGSGLVSGGVYVFQSSLTDWLDRRCSLEGDVFPSLARAEKLLAVPFEHYFTWDGSGSPPLLAGRCRSEFSDRRPSYGLRRRRGGGDREPPVLRRRPLPIHQKAARASNPHKFGLTPSAYCRRVVRCVSALALRQVKG